LLLLLPLMLWLLFPFHCNNARYPLLEQVALWMTFVSVACFA